MGIKIGSGKAVHAEALTLSTTTLCGRDAERGVSTDESVTCKSCAKMLGHGAPVLPVTDAHCQCGGLNCHGESVCDRPGTVVIPSDVKRLPDGLLCVPCNAKTVAALRRAGVRLPSDAPVTDEAECLREIIAANGGKIGIIGVFSVDECEMCQSQDGEPHDHVIMPSRPVLPCCGTMWGRTCPGKVSVEGDLCGWHPRESAASEPEQVCACGMKRGDDTYHKRFCPVQDAARARAEQRQVAAHREHGIHQCHGDDYQDAEMLGSPTRCVSRAVSWLETGVEVLVTKEAAAPEQGVMPGTWMPLTGVRVQLCDAHLTVAVRKLLDRPLAELRGADGERPHLAYGRLVAGDYMAAYRSDGCPLGYNDAACADFCPGDGRTPHAHGYRPPMTDGERRLAAVTQYAATSRREAIRALVADSPDAATLYARAEAMSEGIMSETERRRAAVVITESAQRASGIRDHRRPVRRHKASKARGWRR